MLKKVKTNSLCLTKHHAMKTYGGVTSALDGGEWSASRPNRFNPRERAPSTHWIRGWMGPRAGLDIVSRRKIPGPRRESNPDHPIVQPVGSRYTDWDIPAHVFILHEIRISIFCRYRIVIVWGYTDCLHKMNISYEMKRNTFIQRVFYEPKRSLYSNKSILLNTLRTVLLCNSHLSI
jgi:hypothetical protein